MTTVVISPILLRKYDYRIERYELINGYPHHISSIPNQIILALEIDFQTNIHWWIYLAANYHDSFYYRYSDPTKAIPTQVTGAVGEAMALVIMKRLCHAKNILRITPHPSSQTTDFEMDIRHQGKIVHALVESKGSNRPLRHPPMQPLVTGVRQLLSTRRIHRASKGFLIITSYPARACFLIEVF